MRYKNLASEVRARIRRATTVRIIDTTKGFVEMDIDGERHTFGGSREYCVDMLSFLRDLSLNREVTVYLGPQGETRLGRTNMPNIPNIEPRSGFGKLNT